MKKKLDYFEALYNVAKVINATLELPQVLSEIVRCLTETMGVKASSLRLAAQLTSEARDRLGSPFFPGLEIALAELFAD